MTALITESLNHLVLTRSSMKLCGAPKFAPKFSHFIISQLKSYERIYHFRRKTNEFQDPKKKKVLNSSPRPVRLLGPVGSSWVKLHGRKLGVKGFLDPNLTLRRIQCGAFHKKGACKQLQCHYGWCVYKSNNYG